MKLSVILPSWSKHGPSYDSPTKKSSMFSLSEALMFTLDMAASNFNLLIFFLHSSNLDRAAWFVGLKRMDYFYVNTGTSILNTKTYFLEITTRQSEFSKSEIRHTTSIICLNVGYIVVCYKMKSGKKYNTFVFWGLSAIAAELSERAEPKFSHFKCTRARLHSIIGSFLSFNASE